MIITGTRHNNGATLGKYLMTKGDNEQIAVLQLRGVASRDVQSALVEMDALKHMTKSDKGLYHATINARESEALTPQQLETSLDRMEKEFGLEGQARVVVMHKKGDREHYHAVWSQVDQEKGKNIHIWNSRRRNQAVANALEQEFGHETTNRRGTGDKTSRQDLERAERTGASLQERKDLIRGLWQQYGDDSRRFEIAMQQNGYQLGTGRRGLVVLDDSGQVYALSRLTGEKKKEVEQKLADIRPGLKDVEQQKYGQQSRRAVLQEAEERQKSEEYQNHRKRRERYERYESLERNIEKESPEKGRGIGR